MLSLNFTTSAAAMAHLTSATSTGHATLDENPCGTPTPGHPPHPHGLTDAGLGSRFDKVALNPQPLPPLHAALSGRAAFGGDDPEPCGTVPRHIPHFPPPPPPWVGGLGQPAFDFTAIAHAAAGRY